jgi:toxin HigB-1
LRYEIKRKSLADLYFDGTGASKYPDGILDALSEVVAAIRNARDSRDIRALKGLRFEKVQGKRAKYGDRSLRLNDHYRLIVWLKSDEQGEYFVLVKIDKHTYR